MKKQTTISEKKRLRNIGEKIISFSTMKNIVLCIISVLAAFFINKNSVFAADAKTIIQNLGTEVFKMLKYIGYILAIWGAGSLVLAFKNEDADAKARAIMVLVAAILLFSVKTIFDSLGITI